MALDSWPLSTGLDSCSGNEGAELRVTSMTSESLGGDDGGVANSSSEIQQHIQLSFMISSTLHVHNSHS